MTSRRTSVLVVLVCSALALPARADTTCNASGTSLNFSSYDVFNTAPTDSQTVFVVTCTRTGGPKKTDVEVALGPSLTSGSIANRQLQHAGTADRMNYNLYREASRVSVWGSSSGVDTVVQSITLNNNQTINFSFTMFGRLFASQDVHAGAYSDSVLITLSF